MQQQENANINFMLRKRNYQIQKQKLRKIRNLYRKRPSCWHVPGRDDIFWRNI